MDRPRIALTIATGAAFGDGDLFSTEQLIPGGFDLASAQLVATLTTPDGATVTGRLQGSNDDTAPVNWSDILGTTGTGLVASGIDMLGSGETTPTQGLFVGLFKWVRLAVTVAGSGGGTEGTFVASLVSPGTVGSGKAGT